MVATAYIVRPRLDPQWATPYKNSLKGATTPFLSRVRNCFPSSVSSISAS
jgi:hypothetical protein